MAIIPGPGGTPSPTSTDTGNNADDPAPQPLVGSTGPDQGAEAPATAGGDLIKDADSQSFGADVIEASMNIPVIVDFWAPWCGPCRALTPVIEAAATDYAGKAQVCKMNIDENPKTPSNYEVKAIPTLLIFKGGEVVEQMVGLVSKAKLDEALAKHTS